MKPKKKTQVEAIREALVKGLSITGSSAYKITKQVCGVGTLNLHKITSALRKRGYVIHEYWADGHTHKVFMLDRKKTRKELIK